MGRTLDTLKQAEPQRPTRSSALASAPADPLPQECVVDWTLQEEVPYIEVGGPGKNVEMSAHLVKHPPQARVQPPHPPLTRSTAVVNLTAARPMAVAFEAWPGPVVPAGLAPEIIAHHQPEHPVSKEYAALLDKMLAGAQGPGPHVLMLCGLKPRVGASTVLLNLAVVAARRHRRVASVDMNRARPGLAARLGHGAPTGLHDVVAGSAALDQAIVPTAVPALHLLPAGGGGQKSGPLAVEAATWILAWLRERYDVILIDGPCIEDGADLAPLAACADGIYLVLPQSAADAVSRGVAQTIARMAGRLRGLIHTHFDA